MLSLSRRADYGFYLLTVLAESSEPLSLRTVAKQHDLSFLYLQEVAAILRRAGFVSAKRGTGGGYQLATQPNQINVLEAVTALEGPLYRETCHTTAEDYHCVRADRCRFKHGLALIKGRMLGMLAGLTLADLLREHARSTTPKDKTPRVTSKTHVAFA